MAVPEGSEPPALAPLVELLRAAGAIPTAPIAPTAPTAPTAVQAGAALPGAALGQTARTLNPTARVVVDVFSRFGPKSSVSVKASIAGGQTPLELPVGGQGNRFIVDVPLTARVVTVSIEDFRGKLFGEEVSYTVSASGLSLLRSTPNIEPVVAPSPPGAPGGSSSFEQHVSAFLSRVRDVTAEAERILNRSWNLPPKTVDVLDDPATALPHFTKQVVAPPPVRILELAGVQRPQLIAVCWPANLSPDEPGQFLVYLHHRIDQNRGEKFDFLFERNDQRYPWGEDFLEFGFMHYLDYAGSPLDGVNGGKGLAYQLAASGKPVALVLPMPHFDPDSSIGELVDADTLEDVLLEVTAHKAREAGVEAGERLKRVAFASFSSGVSDQIDFLQKNRGGPFYASTLRELYRFEGVKDEDYRNLSGRWASEGARDDKAVRIYRQLEWSPDRRQVYTEKGFQLWPASALRTYAALTKEVWKRVPANTADDFKVEADIANTMLVDALRRSGF